MTTYTLINLLTRSMLTVQANSRLHARRKARDIAQDDDVCYWIVKQDYHDTTGYKVLA